MLIKTVLLSKPHTKCNIRGLKWTPSKHFNYMQGVSRCVQGLNPPDPSTNTALGP